MLIDILLTIILFLNLGLVIFITIDFIINYIKFKKEMKELDELDKLLKEQFEQDKDYIKNENEKILNYKNKRKFRIEK